MVVTFGAFATGSSQDMKQLGVGLAAAILIDATIVRAVLLPATMKLLGKRNWYLPKRPALAAEVRARAGGRARPRLIPPTSPRSTAAPASRRAGAAAFVHLEGPAGGRPPRASHARRNE